ncbi:MAG: 23S rRNA pseudouridine(2604) synthase RluF [Haliscomenobacter sp.]|uniref:23S rRNA pseudouridine(2604) synthase RluF n=1 Tax=Haliscomenobacter sp. TaxID=2717303 RepID=UPI0029BA8DF2|nr:23S rRNA pseudouridine(2604) synthase RluF [Haliscomenobacter sp.]MDX2071082.1 23S rRNA pseudouridine(2604) synthase RluF [Haliscomenobacter sp.]
MDSISLNKYISDTGICSRREADKFIETGRVLLNGVVAIKGNRVVEGDEVLLDGKPLRQNPQRIYIAFHKPRGLTCTTDLRDKTNVISYINHPQRIFPIGRLDKDSEGLIFLTNDGDIVNKILRSRNGHEKEYIVVVDKPLAPDFVRKMSNGVPILGTTTKKCKVEQKGRSIFKIVLTQGLNRQIRRMCEYLGYDVVKLKRTRIMSIKLDDLAPGKWRYFSEAEMLEIETLLEESTNSYE